MASTSQKQSATPATTVRPPEGFRRVGSVANAGWFNMKKVGNVLHGVLEGMYQRKDELNPKGESKFFVRGALAFVLGGMMGGI